VSTPEAKVKQRVRKILEEHGVYCFMPATGGYGRSGIPDIVGCYRGYFFAIECKAGRGTTTALQDRELRRIREAGGSTFTINENNIEELSAWLRDNSAMTVPTKGEKC
jgi:Holliday junction resolvase